MYDEHCGEILSAGNTLIVSYIKLYYYILTILDYELQLISLLTLISTFVFFDQACPSFIVGNVLK